MTRKSHRVATAVLATMLLGCGHHEAGEAAPKVSPARAVPAGERLTFDRVVDQDGTPFDARRLAGNVWITALMFTSCTMACPMMAERMHYLETLLPAHSAHIKLLSITVDPEKDTPAVLSAYGIRFHREKERWTFVTGDTEPLLDVVSAGYRLDAAAHDHSVSFDHGETLVLVTGEGVVRGYYRKDDSGVKRLFEEADRLASGG